MTATPTGVTISKYALTVDEGASNTYTVVIDAQPSASVTVMVDGAADGVSVNPPSLVFSQQNWNQPQVVTVSAAEDDNAVAESVTLTYSASGGSMDSVPSRPVVVTVAESDTAGVSFPDGSLQLKVTEGAASTYNMILDSEPTNNVTVTVGGTSGDVAVNPQSSIFTPANWSTAQMVTVEVDEDDDAKTDPQVTLTHRAVGGDYGSVSIGSMVVTVVENDLPKQPVNFQGTEDNGQVTLSWNDPQNPDITRWEFQQKESTGNYGPWTVISGSDATTTSHTVAGLTNAVSYSFKVRAVSPVGNGTASDERDATPGRLGKNVSMAARLTRVKEGDEGLGFALLTFKLGEPAPVGGLSLVLELDSASTATVSSLVSSLVSSSCLSPNPKDADMCWIDGVRLIVPAGRDFTTASIGIIGDKRIESDETIVLNVMPGIAGWTGDSITITIEDDEVAPAAPTNLSAAPRNGQALLTWDDPENPGITRYEFQQKEGSDGSYGAWTAISGPMPPPPATW